MSLPPQNIVMTSFFILVPLATASAVRTRVWDPPAVPLLTQTVNLMHSVHVADKVSILFNNYIYVVLYSVD